MLFLAILVIGCSEDTIDDSGIGSITGIVVEQGTNEPIENAKISTNPATTSIFTDENGEFVIADIPVEDYSVEARKEGWLARFEAASVMANTSVNVIFEMSVASLDNKRPSTPEAVFPEDKAEGVPTTTDFIWRSVDPDDDNLKYTLEIRNDKDEEVFLFNNLTDTTYTVQGLDYNNKYFWQVRASDEVNSEVLSPLFSFRTMLVPESRILFTRIISGNNVIFAVDEMGEEFQLTSSSDNSFRPRKSVQSNKIAYLRSLGGQIHLFTMNPDGSNDTQITSQVPVNAFNFELVDYTWIEEGGAILYPHLDKLYKIDVSGGGLELIYQTSNGDLISETAANSEGDLVAVLTTNISGYGGEIFTIDTDGTVIDKIVNNVSGALGGLDLSLRNEYLIYTHDVSGYEDDTYRKLNSRIFLYNFDTNTTIDLSLGKPEGTNDFDPSFSPNEAEIIFVNTSNDGISRRDIFKIGVNNMSSEERTLLIENASMPDWE